MNGFSRALMAERYKGKQNSGYSLYKQLTNILNFIQIGPKREDHVRYCYLHHVRAAMLRATGDCMEHVHQGQAGA